MGNVIKRQQPDQRAENTNLRAYNTVLIPYLQVDENLHIGYFLPD